MRLATELSAAIETVKDYSTRFQSALSKHPVEDALSLVATSPQVEQRKRSTRHLLLAILGTKEILSSDFSLKESAMKQEALESRIERNLDEGRIGLAACMTELDRSDVSEIASKEIAQVLRQSLNVWVPTIPNPSAEFQKVNINDVILAGEHDLRGELGVTDGQLSAYFQLAERYWTAVEVAGLYTADDIAFLLAAGIIPSKGIAGVLVAPKYSTMTELIAAQRSSWESTKKKIDENLKVLRAAVELVCSLESVRVQDPCPQCDRGIDRTDGTTCRNCQGFAAIFTPNGWPAEVRKLSWEERSSWVAARVIQDLGLSEDKLAAYNLVYLQILPFVQSSFELTFEQPPSRIDDHGIERQPPLVVKSAATVPRVVEVIYQQSVASIFSFNAKVFGGITFRFGGGSTTSPSYYAAGGYAILEKMFLSPRKYDDLYSQLQRWRISVGSSLSPQSTSIAVRAAELASGAVREAEAFKVAYEAARVVRDVEAALRTMADRMGGAEGRYFHDGELLLPPDNVVSETYIDDSCFFSAGEAILTCEHIFTRRLSMQLTQQEFDEHPLSPEELFLAEVVGSPFWSEDLILVGIVEAVTRDNENWRVEAKLVPCVSRDKLRIEGDGVPALVPISSRLVEHFEILESILERAAKIPKSGLHSIKLRGIRD